MNSLVQPICAKQALCKCCGALACLYGVVDFEKHCEVARGKGFDPSGVPIYYYRCPACRFLFTTAFDHFTTADFQSMIYNTEYKLVDPDYEEIRPRANAAFLCNIFSRT